MVLIESAAGGALLLAGVWLAGAVLAPGAGDGGRLGVGVCALVGAAWLPLWQPLVGGSLLGRPWLLRIALVAALGAGLALRRPRLLPLRPPPGGAVLALAVAELVLAWPLLRTPTDQMGGGDVLWHLGWTRQLAGGLAEPAGVYGGIPSAYPWLYHSLLAGLLGALPGAMPAALLVLQVTAVGAGCLGAWLLARELGFDRGEAAWAVLLVPAAGGLGWLWSRGAGAVGAALPGETGAYGGDLVLSPAATPALGGLPPVLPRDLGVLLVPLALWAFARGLGGGRWACAGGGFLIGCVALIAPVAGLVAAAGAVALAVARRRPAWEALLGAAVAVAPWAAPFAWHAHDRGGVVNTSEVVPLSLTASQVAVTLGLVPLLAVGGIWLARARRDLDRRAAVALLAVTALTLAVALLFSGDGHRGAAQAFGRGLRYLPFAMLGLAFPAALCTAWLARRAGRYAPLAATAIAVVLLASAASASVAQSQRVIGFDGEHRLDCVRGGTLRPGQTVALLADSSDDLRVFGETGAYLLYRERPRVRFREWSPSQAQRTAWLGDLRAGGRVPADWVLAPGGTDGIACQAGHTALRLTRLSAGP